MMKSILTTIAFLALAVSGLAQTRSVIVNTSGVVQSPTNFWSADVTNARSGLGLGTAATNPATAFQPSSLVLSNLASSNGSELTNLTAANITGAIAISNGGSGATTVGAARTNLGIGWPALTNSNSANALLGYSTNSGNVVMPSNGLTFSNNVSFSQSIFATTNAVSAGGTLFAGSGSTISFYATEDQSRWRTNLGLGWSALTNTSTSEFNTSLYGSGTNPVLYNTNGEVVSPTNFWQVAPIVTRFVEFDPSTNASTNIVAARNLHIHSLAISRTGVTSTIALPTNNVFDGDIALVVHQGPTSSVTAVRTAGAGTNLITLNQPEEAVEFVYYNSVWQFNHNQSFIEPIYFSGTNATANAAASRTNLGLGTTNLVQFAYVESPYFFVGDSTNGIRFETSDVAAITRTNLGLGATNSVLFASLAISNSTDNLVASLEGGSSGFPLEIYTTDEQLEVGYGSNNFAIGVGGFGFQIKYGTNSTNWGYPVLTSMGGTNLLQPSNVTNFRSAIGLPLPALTNTNNANFQAAIFNTNSTPTNGANVNAVNFNTAIHWMEVNVVTNGVTNNFRIPLFK